MNNFFIKILGNPDRFDLKHRIINAVILIGIFLGIQSSIFNYLLGLPEITISSTIITSLFLAFAYYLSRVKGLFDLPLYISLFVSLVVYTPVMWIGNGGSSGGFQYYIFIYLAFSIAVVQRKSVLLTIISFIILLSVFLLIYEYKFPERIFLYPSPSDRLSDLIMSFVSVLVGISALFYVYTNQYRKTNIELQNTNIKIEEQRQILENQNTYINDGINYAQTIQKAVLPPIDIINKNSKENFIYYLPKDKISGDFYYFTKRNDNLIIAVADSTGHGIPGGFMSMLGITMLKEVLNTNETENPSEILNILREKVIVSLDQKNKKQIVNDGFDMALCIVNTKTKRLNYSGANLSLIHIRNKKIQFLNSDKMPIGAFISMTGFTNHSIDLHNDDTIYMFTDGVIDQFGELLNKKFSLRRLQELLLKISDKPMNIQKEKIKKVFRKWRGKMQKTDDALIMGVKIF